MVQKKPRFVIIFAWKLPCHLGSQVLGKWTCSLQMLEQMPQRNLATWRSSGGFPGCPKRISGWPLRIPSFFSGQKGTWGSLVIFAISSRKNANVLVEGRIQPAVYGRLAGKHDDTSGTQFQWEIKKCVGQCYILRNLVINQRLLGHPINACDSQGKGMKNVALCLFFFGPVW